MNKIRKLWCRRNTKKSKKRKKQTERQMVKEKQLKRINEYLNVEEAKRRIYDENSNSEGEYFDIFCGDSYNVAVVILINKISKIEMRMMSEWKCHHCIVISGNDFNFFILFNRC